MDPLRPFATLIKSFRTAKSQGGQHTQASGAPAAAAGPVQDPERATPTQAVTSRLRPHLTALREWNSDRARELFVEHILLAELGDGLARDPAFASLVLRVSRHLGDEPAIRARLDEVLQDLAAGRPVT